jgi:lipoic acid synthetase
MVLGDRCTRNCAFCAVQTAKPLPPDPDEPERLSQAASELGLTYVVITSVCRDDLSDGGASHFAATIRALRHRGPHMRSEVLVPDFRGSRTALEQVIDAAPTVLNHNVETIPRLYPLVCPQGSYTWSLELLHRAKMLQPGLPTKSGLILGLGEQRDEVVAVLKDLREAGCDIVTLGQYLRPSLSHRAVDRYVTPDEFAEYETIGRQMGFRAVASGPLVRSSFMAEEIASTL